MNTIKNYQTSSMNGERSPKGSANNPYTFPEFEGIINSGDWDGGYVEGIGYVGKEVVIYSSFSEGYYFDESWWDSWHHIWDDTPSLPWLYPDENDEREESGAGYYSNENGGGNGNNFGIETDNGSGNVSGIVSGESSDDVLFFQNLSKALFKINSFMDVENDSPAYYNISKQEFVKALKKHILEPSSIDQGNNGTCGAAVICKYLAEYRPVDYVEAAISLYQNGCYKPWEWEAYGPSESGTMEQFLEINTTVADVIIQGAIINSNNIMLSYNPLVDGSGVSSFLWPDYIDTFFDKIGVKSIMNKNVDFSLLSTIDYQNNYVIACVHQEKIGPNLFKFDKSLSFDLHYIQITGCDSNYVYYWQWGASNYKSINGDAFFIYVIPK